MTDTRSITTLSETMVRLYQSDELARDTIYQGYEIRFEDPLGAVDLYEAALERGKDEAAPSDRDLWVAGTHAADGTDPSELTMACPIAD